MGGWLVGAMTSLRHNQKQVRKSTLRKRERLRSRARVRKEAQTVLAARDLRPLTVSPASAKIFSKKVPLPFPWGAATCFQPSPWST